MFTFSADSTPFAPADCSEIVVNHSCRLPNNESACLDNTAFIDGAAHIENDDRCDQGICDLAPVSETIRSASNAFDPYKIRDGAHSDTFISFLGDFGEENRILNSNSMTRIHQKHQLVDDDMDFDILSGRHDTTRTELKDVERNSNNPSDGIAVEVPSFDDPPNFFEVSCDMPGVKLSEDQSGLLGVDVHVVKIRSSCDNEVQGVEVCDVNPRASREVLSVETNRECNEFIDDAVAADWSKGQAVRDSMNNLVEVRLLFSYLIQVLIHAQHC